MHVLRRLDRCDRMIQNESRNPKAVMCVCLQRRHVRHNANYVPYAQMSACLLSSIHLESIQPHYRLQWRIRDKGQIGILQTIKMVDQVAGAQVVVHQVAGTQVLDQVAGVHVVVDQATGARVVDQVTGT